MAVEAIDREAMIELVRRTRFTINMTCGHEHEFVTESDIPYEDMPCPCGEAGHFMIKYRNVVKSG